MIDSADGIESQSLPENHVVTRRLNVHIRGNLSGFQKAGQGAASWTPVNGKAGEVFGVNDVFEVTPDAGTTSSVLQNAVLHSVKLLEVRNEFPLNLGVSISCIPPEETTRTGHKFAFTTLAKSHQQTPMTVFEANDNNGEGLEWRSKFPSYNANNLESEGVLQVTGQNYLFVNKNHPAIQVLRTNKAKLTQSIDDQPLIDDEWYKITKQVFAHCCGALRAKILNRVSTRDMNDFNVQLHRLSGDEWGSLKPTDEIFSQVPDEVYLKGEQAVHQMLAHMSKQNYSFTARLEVKYEIAA